MIELQKCECGARPEIEFDLGDVITLCPSCRRLRRYPGLGKKLRAAFENDTPGAERLSALLGALAIGPADNAKGKGRKNE